MHGIGLEVRGRVSVAAGEATGDCEHGFGHSLPLLPPLPRLTVPTEQPPQAGEGERSATPFSRGRELEMNLVFRCPAGSVAQKTLVDTCLRNVVSALRLYGKKKTGGVHGESHSVRTGFGAYLVFSSVRAKRARRRRETHAASLGVAAGNTRLLPPSTALLQRGAARSARRLVALASAFPTPRAVRARLSRGYALRTTVATTGAHRPS